MDKIFLIFNFINQLSLYIQICNSVCQSDCAARPEAGGFLSAYSAAGAPTGQVSAHAPHSMHLSASIAYLPSPSAIASTGHSAAQAPQEMQSSLILYAIVQSSLNLEFIQNDVEYQLVEKSLDKGKKRGNKIGYERGLEPGLCKRQSREIPTLRGDGIAVFIGAELKNFLLGPEQENNPVFGIGIESALALLAGTVIIPVIPLSAVLSFVIILSQTRVTGGRHRKLCACRHHNAAPATRCPNGRQPHQPRQDRR